MFSKAKLLRISLLIVFVSQSVFAEDVVTFTSDSAVPSHDSQQLSTQNFGFPLPDEIFDRGQNEAISPEEKALDDANDSAPQIYETGKIWADGLEILVPDLLQMRSEVFDKVDAHDEENTRTLGSAEKGIEFTNFEITGENIAVNRPGFGKMKVTVCNGVRLAVFKHQISGRKILIYEDGEIADDSPDLSKLIDALKVRSDDYKGADVTRMVLRHDGSQLVTTHDRSKSILERKWWAEQWNGKWVSPDKNDYVVGAVFGAALQAAATTAVMGLSIHLGMPGAHWRAAPIILSGVFGGALGVVNESYFNWAYNGGFQAVKQAPNAILFSAAMMYFSGHGDKLASITFLATTTALVLASKTLSSRPWRKTFKVRSDLGLNAGKTRFSFYGQDFALSNRSMERSLIYLAPFFIKNFDYFLSKYEKIPFVDSWIKYIPNIEHLPKIQNLLHASMPYFQIGGALFALALYRAYLSFRLDRRPLSRAWPEHKADKVDELIAKNNDGWKKVFNVAGYPEVFKNVVIRKAQGIASHADKVADRCNRALIFLKVGL